MVHLANTPDHYFHGHDWKDVTRELATRAMCIPRAFYLLGLMLKNPEDFEPEDD